MPQAASIKAPVFMACMVRDAASSKPPSSGSAVSNRRSSICPPAMPPMPEASARRDTKAARTAGSLCVRPSASAAKASVISASPARIAVASSYMTWDRGLAAAQVVVVHGGQVVVDQRVAVDALDRRRRAQKARIVGSEPEQPGRFDHQRRAEPLAAVQDAVAHGVDQPLRPRDLPPFRLRGEQAVKRLLHARRGRLKGGRQIGGLGLWHGRGAGGRESLLLGGGAGERQQRARGCPDRDGNEADGEGWCGQRRCGRKCEARAQSARRHLARRIADRPGLPQGGEMDSRRHSSRGVGAFRADAALPLGRDAPSFHAHGARLAFRPRGGARMGSARRGVLQPRLRRRHSGRRPLLPS